MEINHNDLFELSRQKKRSKEDTKRLYIMIEELVDRAKKDAPTREQDLACLYRIYEGLLVKLANRYYVMFNKVENFFDLLSEAKLLFLELLLKYKKTINGFKMFFTYYMGVMLNRYMFAHMQKILRQKPRFERNVHEYVESIETRLIRNQFKKELNEIYHIILNKKDFRRDYYKKVFYLYFIEHKTLTYIATIVKFTPVRVWCVVEMLKEYVKNYLVMHGYTELDASLIGDDDPHIIDGIMHRDPNVS